MDLVNFKVGNENFKDPEQPGIFSGLEIFFLHKACNSKIEKPLT